MERSTQEEGTMKIYNNNPAFGDCGPFESDADTFEQAREQFADEMQSSFEAWADEIVEHGHLGEPGDFTRYSTRDEAIVGMRAEFIKGLSEVA